jgi:uncharacterized protein (TIGR02145 family)
MKRIIFILLFFAIYNTAFAQANPCKDETQKAEIFYGICLKFDTQSAGYVDCIKIFMAQKNKSVEICKNPNAPPPVAAPVPPPVATPAPAPIAAPKPEPAPVIAPIAPPVATPAPAPVIAPIAPPVATPAPAPVIAPIVPPVATPAPAPVVEDQQKGFFTDPRDKKTYKTVKIGEQVWMAENLNYNASGSKCYDNKNANCEKYGRLYKWEMAKKACPNGWHLPRDSEWGALYKTVYNVVGEWETVEKTLKSKSGWNDDTYHCSVDKKIPGNGEDKCGFAVLPGGTYGHQQECGDLDECTGFGFAGICGFFGSTSIINDGVYTGQYDYSLICSSRYGDGCWSIKDYLPLMFSVRCLQGEPQKVGTEMNTFTDTRDSKKYKTVKISLKSGSQTIISQTWMAENLNYNAAGSKCYENNLANCTKYGRLYNWETAVKACPAGWHLPTNEEWDILVNFADGDKPAKKLKAKTGWNGKGNGTDDYRFTALPGGSIGDNGSFYGAGAHGNWWGSYKNAAYDRTIDGKEEYNVYEKVPEGSLSSIRCMKDICDDQPYNSETHFCDYAKNKIYQKCGNLLYNPNTQVCKGSDIFDKCDGKEYNIATQFCHDDKKVYDKCEGNTYNPERDICNGEKKVFHKNGKLQLVGNYKNMREEGKWEEYYDNGNLKSIMNYKDGKRDGKWEMHYAEGRLKSVENYKDGNKEGKWEEYHANENLQSIKIYKDGKPNGKWETYYAGGKLKSVGNYKNGNKDGKWEEYDDNGNLQSIKIYKDGKPDGKWEEYYANRNIKSVENYKNGNKDGKWEEYYVNGNFQSIKNYKGGKPDGKWETYLADGRLKSVENYIDGKKL